MTISAESLFDEWEPTDLGNGMANMTTTFHPFSRLPFELRARVWEQTVEPRTVHVRVLHTQIRVPNPDPIPKEAEARARRPSQVTRFIPRLDSSTPVPATLQTCREARNLGLYQQAFPELSPDETRYAWLNLEIDLIFIDTRCYLKSFKPIARLIERLKFERENSSEYFYHFESKHIRNFANTKEIHVICADGIEAWHQASWEHYWPCGKENVFLIDKYDGRMMNSVELDEMVDQELREAWAAEGYEYPSGQPLGEIQP
ncbi:hypothetical protein F5144DRAFT_575961 [Chaetomium tenue]|uniref:Uncharacterized protein n=1 Tax=Chaetomium tenue TaxID=1854479 RepID=A0ACB7P3L0_9PEZI|nr:hypothetical protein F5144DRAFT_575961 [Chaetomium globosum]